MTATTFSYRPYRPSAFRARIICAVRAADAAAARARGTCACYGCGAADGRTDAGAIFCHDCLVDPATGPVPISLR